MPAKSSRLRCIAWIVLGHFVLAGCAPTATSVLVKDHDMYGYSSQAFSRSFDDYGRPVFTPLSKRPTGTGQGFSIVEFEGNLPVLSHDIVVKNEPSGNPLKPVTGFFRNLGKSILWGLALGAIWFYSTAEPEDSDSEDWDPGNDFETGFVLGTAAGLVYTAYSLGDDTSRLIVNKFEKVESETYYSYDSLGRLTSMTLMPPPGNQWKSKRTEFIYHGEGTVPAETGRTGDTEDTPAGETH